MSTTAPPTAAIKVFISYSWDNEDHKTWVLNLANQLTHNGIHVLLDRYDLRLGKSLTYFMERSVTEADKVVLILTPNYKQKVDDRKGGAGFEGAMISQAIYNDQHTDKFIPVVRKGDFATSSPAFISPFLSLAMTDDADFDQDLETLLRTIYDVPAVTRPPLGARPSFVTSAASPFPSTVPPLAIVPPLLINDANNISITRLPAFSKWKFDLALLSLIDKDNATLFRKINEHLINDQGSFLPFILNPAQKAGHFGAIIYEIPLHRTMAANVFFAEKLKLDRAIINYEYSEYTNHNFLLPDLTEPFSTLFYLLVVIRRIHIALNITPSITVKLEFQANKKTLMNAQRSPFQIPYLYRSQTMEIPGMHAIRNFTITNISTDSLFELFAVLYGMFTSEDPKSPHPFAGIDRGDFNRITQPYLL